MKYENTTDAKVRWNDGHPESHAYDDQYFSIDNGLAETEYVFLKHNNLPQRWKNKSNFVIAETGFGTGLNFLVTSQLWLKESNSSQTLTFISVELHPLQKNDLLKSLSLWPELSEIHDEFVAQYPVNLSGFHRIVLFQGRITLLLLFGDATNMYSKLNAKVDAWFLDGFTPSRNSSMWSASLIEQVARLSRTGTTFSTFTSVGNVRRTIQAAGFEVCKSVGFGKKREMLYGVMINESKLLSGNKVLQVREKEKSRIKPWFSLDNIDSGTKKTLCIIGAGIAGLTTAYVFSKNGWDVTVIDKEPHIASGASGNPIGLVMPRFTADMNRGARFYTEGFLNTVRWLDGLEKDLGFESWWRSGVMHLMPDDKLKKLRSLNLPKELAIEMLPNDIKHRFNITAEYSGLFLPKAGYVSPNMLCQFLYKTTKEKVNYVFSSEVDDLKLDNNRWRIFAANKIVANADNVIVANANSASSLISKEYIETQAVRGQISYLKESQLHKKLTVPLVCENYVTPVVGDFAVLGASYNRKRRDLALDEAEHSDIVSQIDTIACGLLKDKLFHDGRSSFRCTTNDRLPVIGPVPDWGFYSSTYGDIKHGKPLLSYEPASYQRGLFLNTGHGSRGMVSTYNAAELLYAMMSQQPLFIENEVIESLHPARFMIKKLKRAT